MPGSSGEGSAEWQRNDCKRSAFLAGLLWLEPGKRAYLDEAKRLLSLFFQKCENVDMEEVAAVDGLLMAVEAKQIKALYPLVKRVAGWKAEGSPYGMARIHVDVAIALVQRRASNILKES